MFGIAKNSIFVKQKGTMCHEIMGISPLFNHFLSFVSIDLFLKKQEFESLFVLSFFAHLSFGV